MKQFEFIFGTKVVVLLSSALRVSRTYGIDYIDERMMLITFAAEYDSCLYKYFQKHGRSEKDIEDGIYAYCTECLEADYLDEYGFGDEDEDDYEYDLEGEIPKSSELFYIDMKYSNGAVTRLVLSVECREIILKAAEIAKNSYSTNTVEPEHILAAIAELLPEEFYLLFNLCMGEEIYKYNFDSEVSVYPEEGEAGMLTIPKKLAGCLTVLNDKYSPDEQYCKICGRDDETEELVTILSKATKKNAILVGEPGVGKTAIVEKFTWNIVHGSCHPKFKDSKVLALDVTGIVAGTKYRGMAEERFQLLVKFLDKHPECILFIDEIHDVVGAGACTEGELDLSDSLKPILARGTTQVIGATTVEEYERYFSKDGAMKRRFEKIDVKEPKLGEVYDMIKNQITYLEEYHKVTISREVIDFALLNAACFKHTTMNPDRTLDVIDRSMAYAELQNKETVEKEDVLKNFAINRKLFDNMPIAQKRATAYHEVGHALVNLFAPELKNSLILQSISIMPADGYLGITVWEYNEDTVIPSTREYYIQYIASLLAGRRAEKVYTKTISSGASSDLRKASKIAKDMVMKWGLEDFDKRVWYKPAPNDGEYAFLTTRTTNKVDAAIDKILKEAQDYADLIISSHRNEMEILVKELVDNGIVPKPEIDKILKEVKPSKPAIEIYSVNDVKGAKR